MAFYSLTLLEMARILARTNDAWTDIEVKFMEHFVLIVDAMHSKGLWDEEDGFFYDVYHARDGTVTPIKVRSMVGVIPLLGMVALGPDLVATLGTLQKRFARFLGQADSGVSSGAGRVFQVPGTETLAIGVVPPGEGRRVLSRVFDESEFLSPYGLRALSRYHEDHPLSVELDGSPISVDYEPGESQTGMFGGNSNWRGPVWMPVNYLLLRNLQRYAQSLGGEATFEYPTGSGEKVDLAGCAEDLRRRLISLFLRGHDGRRPCHGWVDKLQNDPRWRDNITLNEYFHGDNGAGLGATHQTGWTGLVADLICRPDPFADGSHPWQP
jgi:hypothetical protein